MATSGALAPFLSAMLGLRAQRLQEEEAKARAQQEMMAGIGKAATSAIGAATEFGKQAKADTAANELAQQYFGSPRAGGVPGQAQWDPKLAAKLPGQFTGGEAGLNKIIELEKLKGTIQSGKAAELWKQKNYELAQGHLDVARDRAADARLKAQQSGADQLLNKLEPASKEIYTASQAYQVKSQANQAQIEKAINDQDRPAYEEASRSQHALNALHAAKKLSIDLQGVPGWLDRDQLKAIQTMRQQPGGLPAAYNRYNVPGPPGSPGVNEPGQAMPAPSNYQYVPPAAINKAIGGAQVSPQEFQQIVGQPIPQAVSSALPANRAAPGVSLPIIKGPGGQPFRWDYQLGKPVPITTQ